MKRLGLRVVLYSHDTMGIGHTRRSLLIAERLAAPPLRASVLRITGAHESSTFRTRSGIDYLTLPGIAKSLDGSYSPRSLGLSLDRLVDLRARAIRATLEAFEPDAVIVDKLPLGMFGELRPSLEALRGRTRWILGLRDVLDDPATVRREWERDHNEEAISEFYEAVWIYGDPQVYDPLREYGFGTAITTRAQFTGYLDPTERILQEEHQRPRMGPAAAARTTARMMLCHVGGGQDGVRVAEAFAWAGLPRATEGVLVTGPFMPAPERRRLGRIARQSGKRVIEFTANPGSLLRRAERIVSMGGYNSVCEALALRKRVLIVPRVTPRREQAIRAERLARFGLVEVLHPDQLSADALGAWLHRDHGPPRDGILPDMGGLRRLPRLLADVVNGRAPGLAGAGPSRPAIAS